MTLQLTKKDKEKVDLIKAYFIIRRAMKEIIFRFGSGREIIIGSLSISLSATPNDATSFVSNNTPTSSSIKRTGGGGGRNGGPDITFPNDSSYASEPRLSRDYKDKITKQSKIFLFHHRNIF